MMMTKNRMFEVKPRINTEQSFKNLDAWHTVIKLGIYGVSVSMSTVYKIKKGTSRTFRNTSINPFTIEITRK